MGFIKVLSLTFVSTLWVTRLSSALGVLIALIFEVKSVSQGENLRFQYVFGSAVSRVLSIVLVRLSLEGVAILFRIGNNTSESVRSSRH